MIIFLADLQNSQFRYFRNSIPIGMGYVAAYLKKRIGKDAEIHIFREFYEIYDALKVTTPDIVAFGSYCWNTNLTLNTASFFHEHYPDTLIAVGGPDVSPLAHMTNKDLIAHRQVDFRMPNEGELPVANIVETFLSLKNPQSVRESMIKGCRSINPQSNEPWGEVISRFEGDINEIPSPYFDGFMDRFLDDIDYMSSIQTSRGCPYKCTFCVSGKESWTKVRAFDVQRVKDEIEYVFKRSKNPFLRFADENFGILPRDIEIAEYVADLKKRTGFPQSGSLYTDKHPTDRVKKINLIFKEIIPFNISYQSTNVSTLKNIKRVNLKDTQVQEAIDFARANNLILVSELIFGLPGESLELFYSSFDKLIDLRFESMEVQPLQILKGAEMDTPEDREKFGVQTMFALAEKGYTKHEAFENFEIDEWVVANNELSFEEYMQTLRVIFLIDFTHYRSYLKELLFFFDCYGVKVSDLLKGITQRKEISPLLYESAENYELGMRDYLYETPEQVTAFAREKISKGEEMLGFYDLRRKIMIEFLMTDKFDQAIEEAANVGVMLYKERYGDLPNGFDEELTVIKSMVSKMYIPIHYAVPEKVFIESAYDLSAWIADNYKFSLSKYKLYQPVSYVLRVRGYEFYKNIWSSDETNLTKYRKAFRVFTSTNRRRVLLSPWEEDIPYRPENRGFNTHESRITTVERV